MSCLTHEETEAQRVNSPSKVYTAGQGWFKLALPDYKVRPVSLIRNMLEAVHSCQGGLRGPVWSLRQPGTKRLGIPHRPPLHLPTAQGPGGSTCWLQQLALQM